jgi:hypothetical protein
VKEIVYINVDPSPNFNKVDQILPSWNNPNSDANLSNGVGNFERHDDGLLPSFAVPAETEYAFNGVRVGAYVNNCFLLVLLLKLDNLDGGKPGGE